MTETQTQAVDLQRTSLVDLLDRLIGTGVVLSGDIVISLAGVDLVMLRLRALLTTVRDATDVTQSTETTIDGGRP